MQDLLRHGLAADERGDVSVAHAVLGVVHEDRLGRRDAVLEHDPRQSKLIVDGRNGVLSAA